jgi:phosphatidylserine/phosphatidylglycerophosphate/cardiolipin synthase-like enzyme
MTQNSESGKRIGIKEFLLTLFLMIIVYLGSDVLGIDLTSPGTVIDPDPTGEVRVLFTAPQSSDGEVITTGGLDGRLAEAIDTAQETVDVAAYDFDLAPVADALVRADARGVRVRLVSDSDYADELGPETLQAAGIPVVFDDRDPFMHNKFVVIDGSVVWTGSWNLTENGTYRNNNNVLVFTSTPLAANYTTEFEEMFVDRAFGATSPETIPYPRIDLNGVQVETVFEAEGNVRARILALLAEADTSVYVMAFVFTDDALAEALIDRHRAGVDVVAVIEARNAEGPGSDYDRLRQAGVEILEDGNRYIMHHKVMIVDEAVVVTGSYNFSASAADRNDENVVIVESPDVAARYVAEFWRVYEAADAAAP